MHSVAPCHPRALGHPLPSPLPAHRPTNFHATYPAVHVRVSVLYVTCICTRSRPPASFHHVANTSWGGSGTAVKGSQGPSSAELEGGGEGGEVRTLCA